MAHLPVSLDRESDMPLGAQLAWQLRALIGSGRVAEGERLPGVRELATLAGVNVNTVRTVYGRLADEGLIVSEHGRGTFVGERSRARDELARLASEAAETARAAGVDPRDLAVALYAEPGGEAGRARAGRSGEAGAAEPSRAGASGFAAGEGGVGRAGASGPVPGAATARAPAAEARRRASLRAEIAMLERDLGALDVPGNGGNGPGNGGNGGTGEAAARRSPPTPQLLTAAELERIRDDLVERLRPLRAERDVARDAREREHAERFAQDVERHKTQPVRRQRAIATSSPRFESGAGGWSLRWRG